MNGRKPVKVSRPVWQGTGGTEGTKGAQMAAGKKTNRGGRERRAGRWELGGHESGQGTRGGEATTRRQNHGGAKSWQLASMFRYCAATGRGSRKQLVFLVTSNHFPLMSRKWFSLASL